MKTTLRCLGTMIIITIWVLVMLAQAQGAETPITEPKTVEDTGTQAFTLGIRQDGIPLVYIAVSSLEDPESSAAVLTSAQLQALQQALTKAERWLKRPKTKPIYINIPSALKYPVTVIGFSDMGIIGVGIDDGTGTRVFATSNPRKIRKLQQNLRHAARIFRR